jgi:hypothetical protein
LFPGGLKIGQPRVIHDGEPEVDALLSDDEQFNYRVAVPNWPTCRDIDNPEAP